MKQIKITLLTLLITTLTYPQWPGDPNGYPHYERNYINLQLQILTIGLPQEHFAWTDTINLPCYGSLTNIQTFDYWANGDSSYLYGTDTIPWRFEVRIIQNTTEYYRWSTNKTLVAKSWHDTIPFLDWTPWVDTIRVSLAPGTYQLQLWHKDEFINHESVALNFTIDSQVSVNEINFSNPTAAYLLPTYPNPFNSTTTISYILNQPGKIKLSICNTLGQEITVIENYLMPGTYQYKWQANNLPSGLYTIRLITNDEISTRKIILLK